MVAESKDVDRGPIRALLIGRVSTSEQKKNGTSLSNQEAWGKSAIKNDGGLLVSSFFKDHSGKTFLKEYSNELLETISKNDLNAVYVRSLDRLSRHFFDSVVFLKELFDKKIEVITLTERYCAPLPNTQILTLAISLAISHCELLTIGARTMSGLLSRFRSGFWPRHYVPFGFEKVDGQLHRIEEFEKVVVAIFKDFIKLENYTQTANKINEDFEVILEKKFKASDIKSIVNNEVYIGFVEHGGERFGAFEDPLQPNPKYRIVDEELFKKAGLIAEKIAGRQKIKSNRLEDNPLFQKFAEEGSLPSLLEGKWKPVCPNCQSPNHVVRNGKHLHMGALVFHYKCKKCGHCFRRPMANTIKELSRIIPIRCPFCGVSRSLEYHAHHQYNDQCVIVCTKCENEFMLPKKLADLYARPSKKELKNIRSYSGHSENCDLPNKKNAKQKLKMSVSNGQTKLMENG